MPTPSRLLCPSCGKPVAAGARFCMECGAPAVVGSSAMTVSTTANTVVDQTESQLTEAERQFQLQQLLIEATLGEYEVLGELGRGGMATVYLAHDIALDRKVAIKVIAPALLTSAGAAERFKREARTAAALSHPHIIPIHAVRETPTLLYFVMKFVEGRSLDGIIRERGALPIRMVQAILIEVGQALAYAHRRSIVHRDIKPANIMLDGDGWAMVTDFGIAKVLESDTLTASGTMVGTPYYMSPEQCAGKPVSGASDQYSLGIVAYEMLTGHPPFSGDTIMEIMKGHFFEAAAPVESARSDCPPALAAVVTRMLTKEQAERWTSMDEAVAAMDTTPLAADDPVRSEMISLARSSEALKLISKLSVPVSPIPRGWSRARPVAPTGGGRQAAEEAPEEPAAGPERSGWKNVLIGFLAAIVLAGGGAAAALYFRQGPAPAPAPETSVAESKAGSGTAPAGTTIPAADSTTSARADSTAPPVSAAAPGARTDAQARAAESPKERADAADRRQQDTDEYLAKIETLADDRWLDSIPPGGDPGAEVRFKLTIRPNGSIDELSALDTSSPLYRAAFGCITRLRFPSLPPSLARGKGLPVLMTFNRRAVTAVKS